MSLGKAVSRTESSQPGASRFVLPALAVIPGHLLWRAHARVLLVLAEKLPAAVDIHSYGSLLALADGVPRSQQTLAETISVSRTTMVKVGADLARRGLVERIRNPTDRRSYALTRTPSGADAVRRWAQHVRNVEAVLADPYAPAESDELRAMLREIVRPELASDTPDELVDSLGFLVSRVHFRMHRDVLAALGPLDLEPRHVGALIALQSVGPVAQAELARLLGTSGPSVVQIVDALEARGLVERRRLPTDRRSQVLHLAPEAPEVVADATRIATDTLGVRLAPLTAARTERLVELLVRFVTGA